MSLNLIPSSVNKHPLIRSYGSGGFKIDEEKYIGSLCIFRENIIPWPVNTPDEISLGTFNQEFLKDASSQVLIIGCGEKFLSPPPKLRSELRSHNIVLEWMATGAACRTFNVLITESRDVGAALLAVG